MDIYRKLYRERRTGYFKIIISIIFAALSAFLAYNLVYSGFFIGWEVYFALGCSMLILVVLIAIDIGIMQWIHYRIHIEDGKVKIRDGFFSREICIPLERVFYINSIRTGKGLDCDTIIITDKKTGHKKVKRLDEKEFKCDSGHNKAIMELKYMYPDRVFYYYRVYHHGYKFPYYFYLMYKNCEKCRLSDTSMELVKRFVEG